jgi:hypothetical protein
MLSFGPVIVDMPVYADYLLPFKTDWLVFLLACGTSIA